jgi:hypothetical protein
MVFHLKAFLITCSFKTDINDESIAWIVKYLASNCKYHYTVVEHGESGVAHLHSIFYCDVAKNGADIKNQWWKALDPKQNDSSARRYAIKVNVCHDQTWHDEYLKKEEDATIITDEWPTDESVLTEYYPDAETQKALQAIGKSGYVKSDISDMLEGYQSFLEDHGVDSSYELASGYYLSYNHKRNRLIGMKQLREVPLSMHNWAHVRLTPMAADLEWYRRTITLNPKSGKRAKYEDTVYNSLYDMSHPNACLQEEGPVTVDDPECETLQEEPVHSPETPEL